MAEQPTNPPVPPAGNRDHVPDMTQEMDSARRSLPPVVPVLIAAIVIGGLLYWNAKTHVSKPPATGNISKLVVVEQQTGDRVLVLAEIQLQNTTDKPIYVHSVQAKLNAEGTDLEDDAASGVDVPRYVQAYPALGQSKAAPLINNTKILPGTTQDGVAVFGFEVPKAKFDARKSFEVTIKFYDQLPLVLSK
jgi:hypothetical protein